MNQTLRWYAGKNVLITGGLGFIGSNVGIRLAKAGAKVTVVDAAVQGCGANAFNLDPVRKQVEVIRCNIGETTVFEDCLSRADVIFNLAGEISHVASMENPERDLRLNTVGQLRFLMACKRHCPTARIVYSGTRQVYGIPETLPVDEEHRIEPIDFNGVHKYASTQYHLLLTRRGELDCVVLRLSNIYGPRMALGESQQGFLGVYLRRALDGEALHVYGDGNVVRDPLHIDDAVDALLLVGPPRTLGSRVFNLGGEERLTFATMAEVIAQAGGASSIRKLPLPESLRKLDIGSYYTDTGRFRAEFAWKPKIPFREGVQTTLAFYRKHRQHYLDVANERAGSGALADVSLAATSQ
jgi:UDP-glucose 4-epimerase